MTKLLQRIEEYRDNMKALAGFIAIILVMLVPATTFATHTVGGDITYRCLGNDQYEITVYFYRDCFGGSPEAEFDDPASIAIFDAQNNLQVQLGQLGQLLVPFNEDDTVSITSDCFDHEMGEICVHRTIYQGVVELPFIPGGYKLVYQRCCRNGAIANIVDPLQTGASFMTEISETALASCNSSPMFNEFPPIFVCLNEPINFSSHANDADGDSLVYSLATPLMGASFANPIPQPARKPPYDEILWRAPYGLDDLMGNADDPIRIDQDGVITGTPIITGAFLVGIKVDEYRDGTLIGSTRRDFQFNVVDCEGGPGFIFTGFDVNPTGVCVDQADFEVLDNSIGVPDDAIYFYTISTSLGDTFRLDGKDVEFSVNGEQTVTITQEVDIDSTCVVVKSQSFLVDVIDDGLRPGDTIVVCEGSSIALNPNFNPIYRYTWSPQTYLEYGDGPNPIATPEESILYTVTVYDSAQDCSIESTIYVEVVPNPGVTADFDVEKECNSLTINFINTSMGADTFVWMFGDPTNPDFISNERDPVYTYPEPGTYDAVLTIPGDDCNTIVTKRLPVAGDDFVDFERDQYNCGPSLINLNTGLNPLYIYEWEENPLIGDPTAARPEVYLREDASFNVTVTDPLNETCQIMGVVNVTIDDQLVVDLGDSLYTCEPGSIELNPNGDPDLIYNWTPADNLDDPTSYNPTADITEDIRYVAEITDPNDPTCVVRIPLQVKIGLDDGGFEDGDTLIVCSGSSFFLNPGADPNLVYNWTPTDGLDDPTHPNPIAMPTASTAYTVTVSDSAENCTITKTIYIEIVESDVLVDFEVEKECNSLTVMFINTSENAENYIWMFGDPRFPDSISTEENPTHTYPMGNATYEVQLQSDDDPDCTAYRAMRITLTGEDFMDFETDLYNCGPTLINLNTGLNPNYVYQWEDSPLIGDPTEAMPEVYLREDASFNVTVTDPLNDTCQVTGVVNVTIDSQLVVDLGDSIFICEAGPIELNPDGDPDLIYMWTPEEGLDDATSFNPTANVSETTRFVAKITDPDDPTCMVRIPLLVKIGLDDGGFEDGDTLIVCDSSSLFLNSGANPDLVYTWTPEEGLDDPTHPNPIASPTVSTSYTVTVSDSANTCSITKTIHIEIVDSDVLVDFEVEKECNSLTVMFINTSENAENYIWMFGDPRFPDSISTEENPTHTYPMGNATYEVQLQSDDDPDCTAYRAMRITLTGEDFVDFSDTIETCDPYTIPLNPNRNPNYIYAWAADPAIEDTTAANPIVELFEDRTFYVTVTDPLNDTCTIMGEVVVFPNDTLVKDLPDSLVNCMPGSYELNPNGNPGFTYLWGPEDLVDDPTSFNPTGTVNQTTTFTVTITDPNDPMCTVDTEVKYIIDDYIALITNESIDTVCIGDTVTLTAKADLVDSLSWCDPNGNVLSTDPEYSFPIEISGFYTVKGMKDECLFVDSIYMGTRMLTFALDPDRPVCPTEPVEIRVSANSGSILIDSVIWAPDDAIALGQGSETVVVRPDMATVYTATVSFEDGCVVIDSVEVPISDITDRFSATADPDTIFFGESTTLTATAEDGATYSWTPTDDLQTPNENQTVAIPPETTTYSVNIIDENGCMGDLDVTVTVINVQCEPPHLFLPNAFSPNNDGDNDVLMVRGDYIESMDLQIFNRWGHLIFESTDPSVGWDGTFNGKELSPDVYGYRLMIQCIGGDQHMEQGNITLLQ